MGSLCGEGPNGQQGDAALRAASPCCGVWGRGLMGRGLRWCDAYSVMSSGRIEMVVQLCCFTTTSFMKAWKSAGLRALSVSS